MWVCMCVFMCGTKFVRVGHQIYGVIHTHTQTHTRVCQYTYYNRWVVYSAISIFAYFITFAFHEHMLEYPGLDEHMLEYPVIRVFQ